MLHVAMTTISARNHTHHLENYAKLAGLWCNAKR